MNLNTTAGWIRHGTIRLIITAIAPIALVAIFLGCSHGSKPPVDYVDPFIGTDAGGHTFPGACLPFRHGPTQP